MINRDIHALYLPIRKRCHEFVSYANTHIHDSHVDIYETLRSKSRQADIVGRGASWVSTSLHQLGLAFDVWVCNSKGGWITGKALDAWEHWEQLGQFGEAFGFEWGGSWRAKDMVHFQDRFGVAFPTLTEIYKKKSKSDVWATLDSIRENKENFKTLTQGER